MHDKIHGARFWLGVGGKVLGFVLIFFFFKSITANVELLLGILETLTAVGNHIFSQTRQETYCT